MAAVTILSPEDCLKVLQRWRQDGPTEEEKNEFAVIALAQLNDPDQIKIFQENISQIADLALSIDHTFTDVQQRLLFMTLVFPLIFILYLEWVEFKQRWRTCLRRSCDVADINIDILRRFDMVYLAKVETIQTEQDRISAIQALEPFISELEKNDHSAQMSLEFLTLKRDIAEFIGRFGLQAAEFGIASRKEIEILDEQIRSAQKAVAVVGGGLLEALGLGTKASSVVASLKAQRNKKAENFRDLQLTLAALNKLEAPQIQSQLNDYQPEEPNINLMLERLVIFAEIWSSVRSQAVQFREHLKGGLEASTNIRFKSEVKVARGVCGPLMEGLAEYRVKLEGWISS